MPLVGAKRVFTVFSIDRLKTIAVIVVETSDRRQPMVGDTVFNTDDGRVTLSDGHIHAGYFGAQVVAHCAPDPSGKEWMGIPFRSIESLSRELEP